jgi:dihydroxyacetone kinase-like predicted kinase
LPAFLTGQVTQAVRDSTVDGIQIRAGDYIGLIDDDIVFASRDIASVVDDLMARLLEGGRETLTVLLGAGGEESA